jgi:hypothetical protein
MGAAIIFISDHFRHRPSRACALYISCAIFIWATVDHRSSALSHSKSSVQTFH